MKIFELLCLRHDGLRRFELKCFFCSSYPDKIPCAHQLSNLIHKVNKLFITHDLNGLVFFLCVKILHTFTFTLATNQTENILHFLRHFLLFHFFLLWPPLGGYFIFPSCRHIWGLDICVFVFHVGV